MIEPRRTRQIRSSPVSSKSIGAHRASVALNLFLIATIAFPKGGIKYGGYPITFSTIASLVAAGLFARYWDDFRAIIGRSAGVMSLGFMLIGSLSAFSLFEHGLGLTLERVVPVFFPLATLPFLAHVARLGVDIESRVLSISWIPVGYGVLQTIAGRDRIVIPGLTVNLSDWQRLGPRVFESKNNSTAVGLKLTSTYQNGNLYGVLLVLVAGLLISRVLANRHNTVDLAELCLVIPSILLTYSRTCAIATVCTFLVVMSRRGVRAIGVAAASVSVAMLVIPNLPLSERLLDLDTSGAGRVPLYRHYLSTVAELSGAARARLWAFGFGPGIDGSRSLDPSVKLVTPEIPFVENVWLNLFLMGGVLLVGTYMGPIVWLLYRTRMLRSPAVVGAQSALVGLVVYFSLDQSLNLPPSANLLWIGWTALAAARWSALSCGTGATSSLNVINLSKPRDG